ncbi:unnamed protein product [Toxocara canis]|uniref:GRIP domain-containing protein n=1 Tax=Toxocara canis TaxID=6265 RepID=A0A183VC03_TOXCA|nr:unnamed protein product [Toxocara canis]
MQKLIRTRDKLRTENEELSKQSADIESRGKELEEKLVEISALQHKLEGANAALEMTNKSKEEAVMQEEKEALERSKEEECKLLNEQLSAKQDKIEELARMNEAEIFVVTSELKSVNSDLEAKVKEQEERLKTKDEEMKVALKKQSSMVRELRRQVLQEKKRAEQAERQLDEVLVLDVQYLAGGGRHFRVVGPPLSSEQARGSAEPASSVCSWAFIADSDANSVHVSHPDSIRDLLEKLLRKGSLLDGTLDGEESSCSASVLESDNAELITRLALLQKKHSETMDHASLLHLQRDGAGAEKDCCLNLDELNMVEEENVLLRKEVSEKNELIAEWIRSRPANTESQPSSSSPTVPTWSSIGGMRLRRVFDMVRVDESAADIRDMNRRLQRMLEETLSKNLLLQKDLELLLEKNNK